MNERTGLVTKYFKRTTHQSSLRGKFLSNKRFLRNFAKRTREFSFFPPKSSPTLVYWNARAGLCTLRRIVVVLFRVVFILIIGKSIRIFSGNSSFFHDFVLFNE
jgi:hypothetical protein